MDSVDSDLRNGLWNVLTVFLWSRVKGTWVNNAVDIDVLCALIWRDYFKAPLDDLHNMESYWPDIHRALRQYFFSCSWNEVYDFVEFVARQYPEELGSSPVNQSYIKACNEVLAREVSAYRFVDKTMTQITSEEEIAEVEEALTGSQTFKAASSHLEKALARLTDRSSPDYANSIKESISAVEAASNIVMGSSNATLGQALNQLQKSGKVKIHAALKEAFSRLYGYTSDADGIRHALLDESDLDFEDAKFMLVSCSAFVNYLKTKSAKVRT